MLQISDLRLPPDAGGDALLQKVSELTGVPTSEISGLRPVKRSLDARKKDRIRMVYTVELSVPDEDSVLSRGLKQVKRADRKEYVFPPAARHSERMPVIAGMGPAGLFCALFLARSGIPSIILERGKPVEQRTPDVENFWRTGRLDPGSNVQFGEGGAGTFSDGKLTTGIHDARVSAVLQSLAAAGAPEDILYDQKPHIGTDILKDVVRNLREELIGLGCDVRFENRLTGLLHDGDALTGVRVSSPDSQYDLKTDALVLAVGHSARDTFQMLLDAGLPMEPKPFAVGVRIEHRQEKISMAQYGDSWELLPPADYKLNCHLPSGRGVYTFCVCPGGQVVASASEPGMLVTNGMSRRARDGENCNGAFLVDVTPGDFEGGDPLAGVRFQRRWESEAFRLGGGDYTAPAQLAGDFLEGQTSTAGGNITPTYAPGVRWTDLGACLPGFVTESLRCALPLFDKKVRGFADPEAVLTGVETRSSSPVRILRDGSLQSALRGVYPCGEGCGHAGGIVSAAVDGIRVAEKIAQG